MAPPQRRIPSLDGVRALAISVVMIGHLVGTRHFIARAPALLRLSEIGVRIFFVMSGYLISTLLFQDRQKVVAGTMSRGQGLHRFYIRRVFRIFPAAYLLIIVVATIAATGRLQLLPGDVLAAATFTTNFHHPRAWLLGHLWTLSVEEQFYLLWPGVVLLFGKLAATRVAAAALVVAPAARVFVWYALPELREYNGEAFPVVFDTIATGCILAGLRGALDRNEPYLRFLSSPAFVVVPAALIAAALLSHHARFDLVVGQCTQNLAIALLVDRAIRLPGTWLARSLNSRPVIWLGTVSYSLFVWGQLFINRHSHAWYNAFPVNVLLAFGVAVLSYHFVELPCLRFRARRFPSSQLRGGAAEVTRALRAEETPVIPAGIGPLV